MSKKISLNSKPSLFLLIGCITFFIMGFAVLFLGALAHINPNVHFTGLFAKEPLTNLVDSILPDFF